MSAVKLLTISYAVGVILFFGAVVIIGLNFAEVTSVDPGIPFFTGFVLIFGSKIAMRAVLRRAGSR